VERVSQRELISPLDHTSSFDAFRDRHLVPGENGCLEWRGASHERGYGRLRWKGKVRSAHRVAWSLARGQDVPEYTLIRHLCGNTACCNPEHLRIGTAKENAGDKAPKRGIVGLNALINDLQRKIEQNERMRRRYEWRLARALELKARCQHAG
jgi:hypothetical protein